MQRCMKLRGAEAKARRESQAEGPRYDGEYYPTKREGVERVCRGLVGRV